MADQPVKVHALTSGYTGLTNVITTEVKVTNTITGVSEKTRAIWDTGATGSAITKTLAARLKLIPVTMIRVKGVHGIKENVPVYPVNITLNNENVSLTLGVTECEQLTDNDIAEFFIGMDVINRGDFAITNFMGKTLMSFRVPSIRPIDFVEGIRSHRPAIVDKIPGRNDPCMCGSGKKYKHCCGKQ